MPLINIKKDLKYCLNNKTNFLILILLLFSIDFINNIMFNSYRRRTKLISLCIIFLISILLYGYGMLITQDVINKGKKLPTFKIYKTISLGIKFFIITSIYTGIQLVILSHISGHLNFPIFELENSFINFRETIELFYTHNPLKTTIFLIISAIVAYTFTFFLEIALARLADTGKLRSSLNIIKIKRCIDDIGWKHYAKDYTKIILAIAILTYFKYGFEFFHIYDFFFDLIFGVLIFVIEFLGIAWIYRELKEKREKEHYYDKNV